MMQLESERCAVCDAPAASAPRLVVEQDRHYDCPRQHPIGLCAEHGAALRGGQLAPHEIVYQWTQRHHDELYDGTRLVLVPRLTCLACNAIFATDAHDRFACPECGAVNVIGTALGYPAVIRLES
jgi:hypothetical protein